jgi:hypothetical protein
MICDADWIGGILKYTIEDSAFDMMYEYCAVSAIFIQVIKNIDLIIQVIMRHIRQYQRSLAVVLIRYGFRSGRQRLTQANLEE